MKKIAIIPTLLTLGNAVCGLAAMACASKIDSAASAADSDPYFADAISFGVAPAFLLLRLGPGWQPVPRLHQALAVIAALYMVCAILRLARFNIETTLEPTNQKRFRGLPSPAAAGCVASLAILRGSEQYQKWLALNPELARNAIEIWATLGALTVALLMVSRVPYPHLTKQILRGRRSFRHVVQVIIAVCVIVLIWELALVLLFWMYALMMPLRYLWARALHRATSPPLTGWDDSAPR